MFEQYYSKRIQNTPPSFIRESLKVIQNPEIISFARHLNGKTLLFIGNRNVNKQVGGTIQIPGLKANQKFNNLMPSYGEKCKLQNNKDGSLTVELGTSRALVFEIDDLEIEKLSDSENVLRQQFFN